jgi:hypothetical protein
VQGVKNVSGEERARESARTIAAIRAIIARLNDTRADTDEAVDAVASIPHSPHECGTIAS